MQSTDKIVNTAANRNVIEIDLADYFPKNEELAVVDLKDYLFKGLIVKEDEFRKQVAEANWATYSNKYVCIWCSTDAIIPMWAYMLLSVSVAPFAKDVVTANPSHALDIFQQRAISKIDFEQFEGRRVIVKGCGEREILPGAFTLISYKLAGAARVIMYGEACSSVPVFKKSVD